jgi:hypothetical protein
MGRNLGIAAMVATLTVGGPVFVPAVGTAAAQSNACGCFASFDAIDSDLRYVGRYYNWVAFDVSAEQCAATCDGWRREWFYWNACDYPMRINRGTNAWWGYEGGAYETFIGPDTWWCPFPPP